MSGSAFQVSTSDAAQQLGISRRRVLAMLKIGQLAGVQVNVGGDWLVYQSSVERYARQRRPAHRPARA